MTNSTKEKPGIKPGEKDASRAVPPDHPNKPFRTPNKTKTHPAPEVATDGQRWPEQSEPNKK